MDPITDAPVVPGNPLGLDGLEFIEFASPDPAALERTFVQLGFQKIGQHKRRRVALYRQNQINFVINEESGTFAHKFARQHGPSVCAIGFRVRSAQRAFDLARQRGARPVRARTDAAGHSFPAVFGTGESAIYFVDRYRAPVHFDDDFRYLQPDLSPKGRGLLSVDQITTNVPRGELKGSVDFFERVLGFRTLDRFDIRGDRTGLSARALRSPCGKIVFTINEPTEGASQVQAYLDEYRGAGVRAVTLTTTDLAATVRSVGDAGVAFQAAPAAAYYQAAATRVPSVAGRVDALRDAGIYVDGNHAGYVLQAFTRDVVGPLAFAFTERANHDKIATENARAWFGMIERDQTKSGSR